MAKQTQKIGVSLIVLTAVLLLLTSAVSAASDVATITSVKVKGVEVLGTAATVGVVAGDSISVEVVFTALVDASDVKLRAELEGVDSDREETVFIGDVEAGKTYIKTLSIEVPYELSDDLSDDVALGLKIWNKDFKTELNGFVLRVQREAYKVSVMSLKTIDNIYAGDVFPIDVVLKNVGYNDLEDLYVTMSIPALKVQRTAYLGELTTLDDDTMSGRVFLEVPYSATAGEYALEVTVQNDDLLMTAVQKISVKNEFASNVIATETTKTAKVGEEVVYELLLVNPTDRIKVYRIVPETSMNVLTSASDLIVSVPADLSRTVSLSVKADSEGDHELKVNVFSGDELTGKAALTVKADGLAVPNPMVVLTVVLAVIFVILLGVLIALIAKKPKKQEEFEESYY